jgi:hypothetical protein
MQATLHRIVGRGPSVDPSGRESFQPWRSSGATSTHAILAAGVQFPACDAEVGQVAKRCHFIVQTSTLHGPRTGAVHCQGRGCLGVSVSQGEPPVTSRLFHFGLRFDVLFIFDHSIGNDLSVSGIGYVRFSQFVQKTSPVASYRRWF